MVHLDQLLPSSGMLSTIDPQDLSANECGFRQVHYGVDNLVDFAESSHWLPGFSGNREFLSGSTAYRSFPPKPRSLERREPHTPSPSRE